MFYRFGNMSNIASNIGSGCSYRLSPLVALAFQLLRPPQLETLVDFEPV
jgi:hypothetical protein